MRYFDISPFHALGRIWLIDLIIGVSPQNPHLIFKVHKIIEVLKEVAALLKLTISNLCQKFELLNCAIEIDLTGNATE